MPGEFDLGVCFRTFGRSTHEHRIKQVETAHPVGLSGKAFGQVPGFLPEQFLKTHHTIAHCVHRQPGYPV
ncbi:Uncharacterised protein [Mycobacteroides abscessus subsp. abscessus]|nr:Uncharacterised protein [Mycobacteroides abscessus subsp. abscessus]